jgi:hypothetical protein
MIGLECDLLVDCRQLLDQRSIDGTRLLDRAGGLAVLSVCREDCDDARLDLYQPRT